MIQYDSPEQCPRSRWTWTACEEILFPSTKKLKHFDSNIEHSLSFRQPKHTRISRACIWYNMRKHFFLHKQYKLRVKLNYEGALLIRVVSYHGSQLSRRLWQPSYDSWVLSWSTAIRWKKTQMLISTHPNVNIPCGTKPHYPRKPTTFSRKYIESGTGIEPTISEVKGACSDDRHAWGFPIFSWQC